MFVSRYVAISLGPGKKHSSESEGRSSWNPTQGFRGTIHKLTMTSVACLSTIKDRSEKGLFFFLNLFVFLFVCF